MNIEAVRERIAKKLNTIDDYQVSAYVLTNPVPPAMQVVPSEANHNTAMSRGHEQRDFKIQAMVGLASDQAAQKKLDVLISEDAVPEALEIIEDDDPWESINLESDTGYTKFEKDGSAPLLGVEWTVRVYG